MGDIEKGLMQQVITNERRAEDALVRKFASVYFIATIIIHSLS